MRTILTAYGELDRSMIVRDRVTLDNSHERTLNLEYRVKMPIRLPDGRVILPDEIIKRSAHVSLKEWPEGITLEMARAILSAPQHNTTGFRPTEARPGEISKQALRFLGRGYRFANTQAMCTAFKVEILNGSHAFGAQAANGTRTVTTKDTFKMALYLTSASRGAGDTVYNTTGELAGTGNYTQGGTSVTNATAPTSTGTTAFWTPSASVSWANLTSSGNFDAALLYNDASTNKNAVAVFTFGTQSITAGTFTLTMPTNDATTGLIRIA